MPNIMTAREIYRIHSWSQWEAILIRLHLDGVFPEELTDEHIFNAYINPKRSHYSEKYKESLCKLPFFNFYKELSREVLCHKSTLKLKVLYRFFYRCCEDPSLLMNGADDDYLALKEYRSRVLNDVYAVWDNIRFQKPQAPVEIEWSVCYPQHFISELLLEKMNKRKKTDWVILSPIGEIGSIDGESFVRWYPHERAFHEVGKPSDVFSLQTA